jgi:ribosomal protein L7/L12
MDFSAVVRSSLEAGHTPDQVAQALIDDHHLLPISAIKALRTGGDMSLVEAKELIKRNLSAERWGAAEPLWEMIAAGETVAGDDH